MSIYSEVAEAAVVIVVHGDGTVRVVKDRFGPDTGSLAIFAVPKNPTANQAFEAFASSPAVPRLVRKP